MPGEQNPRWAIGSYIDKGTTVDANTGFWIRAKVRWGGRRLTAMAVQDGEGRPRWPGVSWLRKVLEVLILK